MGVVVNLKTGRLAPTKHRVNVAEYYRMSEVRILKPDLRVELIDVEVCDLDPISPARAIGLSLDRCHP